MPTYDLKKAATAVTGGKRVPFGLCMGMPTELVISADIPTVLKQIGKSKVDFRGVCFREGETLVFATKDDPKDSRKTMLTRTLKAAEYAGAAKIELRKLAPGDADGTDMAGAPSSAVPVSADPPVIPSAAPTATAATPTTEPATPLVKPAAPEEKPPSSPSPEVAAREKRAREALAKFPPSPTLTKLSALVDAAVRSNNVAQLDELIAKTEAVTAKQSADEKAAQETEELRSLVRQAVAALDKLPAPEETKTKLKEHIKLAYDNKDRSQLAEMISKFGAATLKVEGKATADKEAAEKAAKETEERTRRQAEESARGQREAEEQAEWARARAQREADERVRAQREADERVRAQREADERARRETQERAERESVQREADEGARREAEQRAATAEREAVTGAAGRTQAGTHRGVAATLGSALTEDDLTKLDDLPPQLAASVVNILKTAEGNPAAKKTNDLLRGALRFGAAFRPAVDPDTVVGLSPEQKAARRAQAAARQAAVTTVLGHFQDQPEIAAEALKIIPDAEHPGVVAGAIPKVGELRAGNFAGKAANATRSSEMAVNALKMAGTVGGDFNERLTAYYGSDVPKADDAWRDAGGDAKKTALRYTAGLGDAMLGADGTIQTDGAAMGAIRDNLHFHPDSLRKPMFNLARQVEKFRTDMASPEIKGACDRSLATITANPQPGMVALIRSTLGLAASTPVNALTGKKAVLSAAVTPLTQGQAGSCFATCNCMDYQEHHPDQFFGDLCEITRTGSLRKGAESVPAATNIPAGDNKLLRSLEYTVASLGASKNNSVRRTQLAGHARQALSGLKSSATFKNVSPALATLHRDLATAVAAEAAARNAYNDNLNARGQKYEQYQAANGARRNTLASEIEGLDTARTGLDTDHQEKERNMLDLRARADNASDAMAAAMAEAVSAAVAFDYDATMTLPSAGVAADGNSSGGGWRLRRADNRAIIADGDLEALKKCLADKVAASLPPSSNRAHIDTLVGSATFLDSLRSQYTHTGPANAREASGSIYRHVAGGHLQDSKEVLAGRELETTPVVAAPAAGASSSAKARALLVGLVDQTKTLDKEVSLTVRGIHGERAMSMHPSLDALKAGGTVAENADAVFAKTQQRAQTPMAPEEIQLFVDKSLRGVLMPSLGARDPGFDLSSPPFTEALKPAELKRALIRSIPRQTIVDAYGEADARREQAVRDQIDKKLDSLFVGELFPQFVVADTNWGDANGKHFHVVTADLETGEPKFCSRDESTGQLTEEEEGFVNAEWQMTVTRS